MDPEDGLQNVTLAPGDMVRAKLRVDLDPGLASGDYTFTTVFGAVSTPAIGAPVAGDINGDGVPDFIVGADQGDAGKVYLYSGADGALLYQLTGDAAGDRFGTAFAGVGDVNGDGKADFVVGATLADAPGKTNAGKVYVYSGADGTLLYQKTADASGDVFGISVSGLGDVNGDGIPDLIVGARDADAPGKANAGKAYVYSGADGALLYQKTGDAAGDSFHSVSGVGDVNGDGVADFIVGAYRFDTPSTTEAGKVYVYSGADGALLYQVTGDTASDGFAGSSLSGVGDVNGDLIPDFIVGAFATVVAGNLNVGKVYVYSGADGVLLYQKTGDDGAYGGFGVSVSGVGDANGDGKADFIVGTSGADPSGKTDAGKAYTFSGANGAPLYSVTGDESGDLFANSLSGVGDVNGDGKSDFIVGANRISAIKNFTDTGKAYVYSGADGALLYSTTGDVVGDYYGLAVSGLAP